MKKVIACIATATALSAGAGSAAFAAEGDPPTTETTKPANEDGSHRGVRRAALRTAAQAAAEAIGVETAELRTAFKAGTSVAELAASKGVDVATVTQAIVTALSEKIDQAVENGKIDAERAAKVKERLPQLAERLMNRTPGG